MQVAYWTYKLDIAGPVHLLFDHMESWTNFWRIRCFFEIITQNTTSFPGLFSATFPLAEKSPENEVVQSKLEMSKLLGNKGDDNGR